MGGDLTFAHSTHPHVILIEDDPETTQRVYKAGYIPELPDHFATITGDVVHNLRSSLDLLIGQLRLANGKSLGEGYFPISDTREKFKARCKAEVEGHVGKDAFKLVCATEAYRGGKGHALWQVHRLDIEDKHRLLFVVGFGYRSFRLPFPTSMFPPGAERVIEEMAPFVRPADRQVPLKQGNELFIDPDRTDPKTEPKLRLDVAFSESEIVQGEPILPTLLGLTEAVEGAVEDSPRFWSRDLIPRPL